MVFDLITDYRKKIEELLSKRIGNARIFLDRLHKENVENLKSVVKSLGLEARINIDRISQMTELTSLIEAFGYRLSVPKFQVDEENVRVILDVPGFTKENIELDVAPQQIILSGKAVVEGEERNIENKVIPLPKIIDPDSTQAKLENGILVITCPIVK
ncbi:MAG: Hsp20/alpha crystallin family protein [Promethearchaeota archaeon]|nr:MAG: Hsp20/alpha crystallin family protein [Candidatus Lokiarchaeota archaeon]